MPPRKKPKAAPQAAPPPDPAPLTFRHVIMSRGRARYVKKGAWRLFPSATWAIYAPDVPDYVAAGVPESAIIPVPADVEGIGPVRQWILDHVADHALVLIDDDVQRLYCLVGRYARPLTDPTTALAVLVSTANAAHDAGAPIFGWAQAWDVRKFHPHDPFRFNLWAGGVVGFIGRRVHYDQNLKLRADVDAFMQVIARNRYAWLDCRYAWQHRRFDLAGGTAPFRSQERIDHEIAYLRQKWGAALKIKPAKTTVRLVIDAPRRQQLTHF